MVVPGPLTLMMLDACLLGWGEQADKLWSVTVDIMLLSKHIQAWDANARLTGYKMKNQGLLSSWIMHMWLFQSETLDLFLSTKSFQEP